MNIFQKWFARYRLVCQLTAENARLLKMWEEVHIENRRLRANYAELSEDFEDALGPHPHGNGATGSWIARARAIRVERDRLRVQLAKLFDAFSEPRPPYVRICGCDICDQSKNNAK